MIIQSDIVIRRQVSGQSAGQGAKEKEPWASAQVLEKAQVIIAKAIQGNQSLFLCCLLIGARWVLLDLAKFGSGLELLRPRPLRKFLPPCQSPPIAAKVASSASRVRP
jgi:hypothetical protein